MDGRVAALAAAQHGVVTLSQLRELGLGDDAIHYRLGGTLHSVHRGVYAVGHSDLSLEGRFLSAVLSVGPGAVLSHIAAAILWDFWPLGHEIPSPVDVTAPRKVRPRPGIRAHRARVLPSADTTRHHRIPVTTPARTLLDLADTIVKDRRLKRAIHEAEVQRRVNHRQLTEQIVRTTGRAAATRLSTLIADGPAPTRSEMEDLTIEFLERHGFPDYQTNARLDDVAGRPEVDVLFPHHRVVIEADSRRFHDTPFAREQDARTQAMLEAAGYRVIRVTWDQLNRHEEQTAQRLWPALAAQPPGSSAIRSTASTWR